MKIVYTYEMEVHPIAYVYLIFAITSFLIAAIAAAKGDTEKALTFACFVLWFGIGFSCNYQVCPMFFCIGVE